MNFIYTALYIYQNEDIKKDIKMHAIFKKENETIYLIILWPGFQNLPNHLDGKIRFISADIRPTGGQLPMAWPFEFDFFENTNAEWRGVCWQPISGLSENQQIL